MKKKIYKIISLVFAILFILISPIGSYYNSKQSVAYAFEAVIDDATSKYVLPVAAYMLLRMQHELEGLGNTATVTINAVQQKIDELSANSAALMRSIPKQSKAIIAKVFTDMTTEQINTALGTTYTDLELDSLSAEVRSQRQSGTLGSTYKNIYDLGIAHIFASSVKLLSNNAFDKSLGIPVYDYLGESYRNVVVGSYEFRTKQHYFNYEFLNSLGPVLLTGYFTSGVRPDKSFVSNQIIQFGLYRIRFHVGSEVVWPTSNSDYSVADDAGVIDNFEFLSSRSYQEDYIFIEYLENSTWTILKQYISSSSLFLDSITAKSFLDDLFIFTGKDLSSLFFYSDSYFINDLMNFLYQGEFVLNPAGTLSIPLNIPALDSGFWGEDVSETPAERVTGAIGISSATWDVDVGTNTRANDDPDTNEDIPYVTDVVLSPSTDLDVPDVDTGNPSFPEEGGDVGNPDDTSGILGWLKGFWDLLKALWEKLWGFLLTIITLLTNIFNTLSEGNSVDWGNFKGFFDVFYIFYYLIILAIIMLIKFFGVIVTILDIPANTALFDQYPTMLAGLNYLKNLKIGGFNITLQQIFEYMFTVFFFLYIVTTLQKLYHSFTTIERQSIREMERQEAKIYREENK